MAKKEEKQMSFEMKKLLEDAKGIISAQKKGQHAIDGKSIHDLVANLLWQYIQSGEKDPDFELAKAPLYLYGKEDLLRHIEEILEQFKRLPPKDKEAQRQDYLANLESKRNEAKANYGFSYSELIDLKVRIDKALEL